MMVTFNSGKFITPELPEEKLEDFVQTTAVTKGFNDAGKAENITSQTDRKGYRGNVTRDEILRTASGNEQEEEITIVVQGFEMDVDDTCLFSGDALPYTISKERPYYNLSDIRVYEGTLRKAGVNV